MRKFFLIFSLFVFIIFMQFSFIESQIKNVDYKIDKNKSLIESSLYTNNLWKLVGNSLYPRSSNYRVGIGTNEVNSSFVVKGSRFSSSIMDDVFQVQENTGFPFFRLFGTLDGASLGAFLGTKHSNFNWNSEIGFWFEESNLGINKIPSGAALDVVGRPDAIKAVGSVTFTNLSIGSFGSYNSYGFVCADSLGRLIRSDDPCSEL